MVEYQWQIKPKWDLTPEFLNLVKTYAKRKKVNYLAQILWQRNIRQEEEIKKFLDSKYYQPTKTSAFGQEIKRAINRLLQAKKNSEKVAIWGDFDADGVTATSVLWEGLGQIFLQNQQLSYYIPNRFTESHGLNCQGIAKLAQENVKLIVTCDTGSTNLKEIEYATKLGIDIIITDHHTLPDDRPEVVSILNPRYFAENHPLYHLSGVAVAYKLVEAVYQKFAIPDEILENLLDLVAIGLISDLVQLRGDCRYLAQLGIEKLQERKRYGLDKLLDLCNKTGDRPMDISFGIGPRINAVSRIKGDASFCVELLTSKEKEKAEELAVLAEEANLHRKEVQNRVLKEARKKLEYIDLSTTGVIVLLDNQWESGVLGLVANSIAQEYARPTILLTTDGKINNSNNNDDSHIIARGSARSIQEIDLYELVASQKNLLSSFGGHPFAAGLALPLENLSLFTEGINQDLRRTIDINLLRPIIEVDLVVTVSELGQNLFRELKLLQPFGMGNAQPKLLIKNCQFTNLKHFNYTNRKGQKIKYIKTTFQLMDKTTNQAINGCWWGHYAYEIDNKSTYDLVCELDFNTYSKEYEIRIIDLKLSKNNQLTKVINETKQKTFTKTEKSAFNDSLTTNNYQEIWQKLLGIIKYLINHQKMINEQKLLTELEISNLGLEYALKFLQQYAGISYEKREDSDNQKLYSFQQRQSQSDTNQNQEKYQQDLKQLIDILEEEFFQKKYLSLVCSK